VNVATANQARFSALLIESDNKGGLESALREQGCSVRRATTNAAAQDALEGTDVIVISSQGFSDDDVIDLIGKAQGRQVLVVAESTDLAVKAAKQGAIVAGSFELASAQLGQLLSIVDLKRKVRTAGPVSMTSPTSGVVQRRSTPLPKEATPDALEALIEAAECLVPMHRFQRVYVDYALRRFGGNKVHTAAALGIDRRTIQRWARARAESSTASQTAQSTTSS
jgi:DNA-binding NtrC family response regulator